MALTFCSDVNSLYNYKIICIRILYIPMFCIIFIMYKSILLFWNQFSCCSNMYTPEEIQLCRIFPSRSDLGTYYYNFRIFLLLSFQLICIWASITRRYPFVFRFVLYFVFFFFENILWRVLVLYLLFSVYMYVYIHRKYKWFLGIRFHAGDTRKLWADKELNIFVIVRNCMLIRY